MEELQINLCGRLEVSRPEREERILLSVSILHRQALVFAPEVRTRSILLTRGLNGPGSAGWALVCEGESDS